MKRRSFLTSIVAALAMSPLLCRMVKGIGWKQYPFPEVLTGVEKLLSPYFFKRDFCLATADTHEIEKVVRHGNGEITVHWGKPLPKRESVAYQPPTDEEIQRDHQEFLANREMPMRLGDEPAPGSFEDTIFPKC